jgi:peptidoglycan/LPS O-acetylase OafA/YrhL
MRSVTIDVLRAVACLLVLARHCSGLDLFQSAALRQVGAAVRNFGWTGVNFFFVLSGFLVSGLLFREYQRDGRVSAGRFLLRRGLKIYPAFYALLLVGVYLHWDDLAARKPQFVHDALFLQNYSSSVGSVWPHCWSLAVEEHFYIGLAVVTVFLTRFARRDPFAGLLGLYAAAALACLYSRAAAAAPHYFAPVPEPYWPCKTHMHLDALLFGVLLSYLYHFRPAALGPLFRRRWAVLVLSLALLSSCWFARDYSFFTATAGTTMAYLGYGGVLVVSLSGRDWGEVRGRRLWRGLAWIGTHSYSIYLWHWMFVINKESFTWAANVGGPVAAIAWYFVICIGTGAFMGRLIELPFLALRDRLVPSAAGPVRPAGAPTEVEPVVLAMTVTAEVGREGTLPARVLTRAEGAATGPIPGGSVHRDRRSVI